MKVYYHSQYTFIILTDSHFPGGNFVVFSFDGGIAPKGGLNSLLFTVNPEDYNRVVDVIITPTEGSKEDTSGEILPGNYSTCCPKFAYTVFHRPKIKYQKQI